MDARFYGDASAPVALAAAVEAILPYVADELAAGTRLPAITRHMLGLYQGVPGARRWRQMLTVDVLRPGAGVDTIRAALAAVSGDGRGAGLDQ